MKKNILIMIFILFLTQFISAEEDLNLIPDINPSQTEEIYQRYLSGVQAPDIQLLATNGSVVPFNEIVEIDEGVTANYVVYSLTNFKHESGVTRDITTSKKSQYRHDCTKFATLGAMEIEITRQYFSIFNDSFNFAEENGGNGTNVEIDLSEGFEREVNGCNDNTADTVDRTIFLGVIQEEHYPYNERKFLDKAYYSKRDTERYGFSNGFSCRDDISFRTIPNFNDTLINDAFNENILFFKPLAGYVIREKANNQIPGNGVIDRIKYYILHGKPATITYTVEGVFQKQGNTPVDLVNNPWGKMINPGGGLNIFDVGKWTNHGAHAVVVVGYMEPVDPANTTYLLIKNSHGGKSINAFPTEGSGGDLLVDALRSVDVFDSIAVEKNGIAMTENDLVSLDTDGDGVPDIFDNSSFSGTYFGNSNFSYNPDQAPSDGDSTALEFDLCPYIADDKKFNMDHDNKGDFCDYDIDGDGISNIDEGMSQDLLYKVIESSGAVMMSGQYAALNPFLRIKDGGTLVLWNKYFITSCFAGLNTHCDEPDANFCTNGNKPGASYISDLCFYDDTLLVNAPVASGKDDKDGTYKFFGGAKHYGPFNAGEELTADFPAPHGYYKKIYKFFIPEADNFIPVADRGTGFYRNYTYKDDDGRIEEGYGLSWNIPGQFEMKELGLDFETYKNVDNYGENWPESYYNCYLHCKMLDRIDFINAYFNVFSCQDACEGAYFPACNDPDDSSVRDVDYDCDGIRDIFDNCPFTPNTDQKDTDSEYPIGYPIGDGVGDACDNCQGLLNPREMNNSEIVSAPCDENDEGGAAAFDCMPLTAKSTKRDKYGNYYWQPDHDLDGEGDNCDQDTIWTSFRGIPQGVDSKTFINGNGVSTIYNIHANTTVSVLLDMNSVYSSANYTSTNRFCWVNRFQHDINLWGAEGFCTTEAKYNPQECEIDFGYSHGSDPKPLDVLGAANWKSATYGDVSENVIVKGGEVEEKRWKWRQDIINDNNIYREELTVAPICDSYDGSLNLCNDR